MKTLVTLALLAFPLVTDAHDFWIEPSTFRPAPNSLVRLRLRVGEHYLGDPVPRKAASELVRFDAHMAGKVSPIVGTEGDEPAGTLTIPGDGLVLIAYHNKPAYVEMTEEKLRQYLREEGLERIHDVRARSAFARQPWREIYSRCAKSLLWTGRGNATVFNKRIGMPLELIPEENPYSRKPGDSLPVLLLYRGKPLSGAHVVAIPDSDPNRAIAVRSDGDGRVHLKLHAPGKWMIKSVHIVPAPAGARGQWESFWASLTFDLPR